jgi:hypothetical protein
MHCRAGLPGASNNWVTGERAHQGKAPEVERIIEGLQTQIRSIESGVKIFKLGNSSSQQCRPDSSSLVIG